MNHIITYSLWFTIQLKDREVGLTKKPEDYIPKDLFQNERLNPQQFEFGSSHPMLGDIGMFQLQAESIKLVLLQVQTV